MTTVQQTNDNATTGLHHPEHHYAMEMQVKQ
jgi:hypothetical protein